MGIEQPGGWIYQILPQMEATNVWVLGKGESGDERIEQLNQMLGTPIAAFACPSRGYQLGTLGPDVQYVNASPKQIARTDYAINEGDRLPGWGKGPNTLAEGDSKTFEWLDPAKVTGIASVRFGCKMAEITDGTTNTYLCGEKHVGRRSYFSSENLGYD